MLAKTPRHRSEKLVSQEEVLRIILQTVNHYENVLAAGPLKQEELTLHGLFVGWLLNVQGTC